MTGVPNSNYRWWFKIESKNTMKILAISIALVIVASGSVVTSNPTNKISGSNVSLSSTAIYVPDDYSTIPATVDNASVGDTIFVYNRTYFELILTGEYRNNTIIDGYLSGSVSSLEERDYTRDEVVSVGSNSFDMSWVTSTELRCFFDYGLSSSDLNNILPAPDLSTKFHWVKIKGLDEEKTYYYRINCSFNETNNFTTLPLGVGSYLFSFAVATDIHWSSSDSISKVGHMYNYSNQLLADLVSTINAEDVYFTILLGDLTDNGQSYEFDTVSEHLNDLDKPFYTVIGNHDKFEGSWVTKWAELFHENTTYSFDFSGWHFIVLDSANDTNPNQGILTKDIMKWLHDDLKALNAMPTIICLHFLVNELPELPSIPSWSPYIDNRKEFKDLLDNYPNVVAVLSGHGHFNSITCNDSVAYIETASIIQYPIAYDIYHIYEHGFIKTQHKLYQDLNISELSREKAVTYLNGIYHGLGDYYVNFNFGTLSDRAACVKPIRFGTGTVTYPSIMGTHKGRIKPPGNIRISRPYTYPCAGTGGHTDFIESISPVTPGAKVKGDIKFAELKLRAIGKENESSELGLEVKRLKDDNNHDAPFEVENGFLLIKPSKAIPALSMLEIMALVTGTYFIIRMRRRRK